MERLCRLCGFWMRKESGPYGSCRRYAPRAYVIAVKRDGETRMEGETIFPETCNDDWCGEFVSTITAPPTPRLAETW